jgi:membrane glycosyltransferase
LRARRKLVVALNLASWCGLGCVMAYINYATGWSVAGVAVLVLFLIALPWTLLAFWNSVIGFVILCCTRDPAAYTNDALRETPPGAPIERLTAICIAIRHEDVSRVASRLATMRDDIRATGEAEHFEFHVLSDSAQPEICAAEAAAFGSQDGVFYRRRPTNTGFKAGNLRDFACVALGRVDFMLVLDADSLMSAAAILRLVRVMQANPRLGILQTLVTGRPATSPFARIFQFGMRHGMRTHTAGIAWWQGSSGPYWGHNALIRLRPLVAYCELPVSPERQLLGGHLLSHDQVEATLMRAAGMEVRVIADEFGSWEENPPRLPDFIRRDLRWCQGNLQYLRLVGRPGLLPMGRFQLCNAIAMYLGAPASVLMLTAGVLHGLSGGHGHVPGSLAFGMYFGMPGGAPALGRCSAAPRGRRDGCPVHLDDRASDDGGADSLHHRAAIRPADHLGSPAARRPDSSARGGGPRALAAVAARSLFRRGALARIAGFLALGSSDAGRLATRHSLRLRYRLVEARAVDDADRALCRAG